MSEVYELQYAVRPRQSNRWLLLLLFLPVFFLLIQPHEVTTTLTNPEWAAEKDVSANVGYTESGNIRRQIALVLLVGFAAMSLSLPSTQRMRLDPWLAGIALFFAVWAFSSVVWAEQALVTMRKLTVFVIFGVSTYALARRNSPRELMTIVFAIGVFQVFVTGFLIELALGTFVPWALFYRFGGMLHPNCQGDHVSVVFLAAMAFAMEKGRRWQFFAAFAGIALVLLFLTKSRGAVVGVVLALGYCGAIGMSNIKKIWIAVAGIGLICCLCLAFGEESSRLANTAVFLGRADDSTNRGTLNSRLPLWKECIGQISDCPLTGVGYDSFWSARRLAAISSTQDWSMATSHNAYLDIALGLGLIGGAAIVLVLGATIFRLSQAYRQSRSPVDFFFCAFVIATCVRYFFESSFRDPTLPTFLVYIIVLRTALLSRWSRFVSKRECPSCVCSGLST